MTIQNHELLANAVVEQAAKDYRSALCAYHKYPTSVNQDRVDNLERFFKGDMIKIYTKLDGPTLMNQIKQHAAERGYSMARIRKDIQKTSKWDGEE